MTPFWAGGSQADTRSALRRLDTWLGLARKRSADSIQRIVATRMITNAFAACRRKCLQDG